MTNFTMVKEHQSPKSQTLQTTRDMENKSNNFRAKVMKYAWAIRRATKQALSVCLRKAWELYRLARQMRAGVVTFCYLKADGTIRKAVGTLRNLPAGITYNGKRVTKPSYKTFAYFDIEKNSFRSFKTENLISVVI